MHYDASTRWIKTKRPGSPEYSEPRQRGTVTVEFDSKIYVYRFPQYCDKSAAKRALAAAFAHDGKLTGAWPVYSVRSE
jgi:hypothetical protein